MNCLCKIGKTNEDIDCLERWKKEFLNLMSLIVYVRIDW
jgi:hypothetical protein